ncbi:tetratricopeptide repeat protein [Thiorhodovibrio frisius]|uniref:Sel1 repeat protein n=1 Tax=Thiorhodovibrio frisius TaxID=631362 RepID=H8Z2U0_9GAMM|nr:SEL1-like repeat protein [Thiorhodovibrio frisius]EIC21676.1 Sel1 repeat protein [Thiorhodovibrio frisius]WPL21644.1 Sel1 repeat [Thiorhodovibrio frisius]
MSLIDEEAFKEMLGQAESGNTEPQLKLGDCYRVGHRLGFDMPLIDGIEPCIYWYQKAAEQGNKNAQRNLYKHYQMGIATDVDKEKAEYWRRKYAE